MKKTMIERFPYATGERVENKANDKFNARFNNDHKPTTIAIILGIVAAFIIALILIVAFGVAIDSLPTYVWSLFTLLSISGIIGVFIIRSANKARKKSLRL